MDGTQDLGWYRLTFDRFGIPYDLIYKEQVKRGDLAARYDVIVMAAQSINRQAVAAGAALPGAALPTEREIPVPRACTATRPTCRAGSVWKVSRRSGSSSRAGGTLIAAGNAVRFPIEFGWARTVDVEQVSGVTAQRPIVEADIVRPEHPAFYGYAGRTIPLKYVGGNVLRVGVADQGHVLGRYVGGDSSVLSGLMVGADQLRQRAFAVDLPNVCERQGEGRAVHQQPDLPLAEPR